MDEASALTGARSVDAAADEVPWSPTVALMLFVLLARIPDAFGLHRVHNDVDLFLGDQARLGFAGAFALRYEGYLHAVPRIAAAISEAAGPAARPMFVGIGMLVGAVCTAWMTRREFRVLIPDDRARLVFCCWWGSQPGAGQLVMGTINAQWYLLWLGLLLAIAPAPVDRRRRVVELVAWTLIGLSAPGAVAFVPLLLWRARRERFYALCALPSLIEVATFDWSRIAPPWTHPAGFLARAAGANVAGEADPLELFERFPVIVIGVGVLATAVAVGLALRTSTGAQRTRLAWALGVTLLYLAITVKGRLPTWWGNHGRYLVLPAGVQVMAGFIAWQRSGVRGRCLLALLAVPGLIATVLCFKVAS